MSAREAALSIADVHSTDAVNVILHRYQTFNVLINLLAYFPMDVSVPTAARLALITNYTLSFILRFKASAHNMKTIGFILQGLA